MNYFKNLDGIRFIAAMMVFVHHSFGASFEYLFQEDSFILKVVKMVTSGGLGVSIFFVLSGFLITYLLIAEYKKNGQINLRKFYFRRFLRIWPLYYAVVLFTFIVYPLLKELIGVNQPLASNVWYHLFFMANFDVLNIMQYYWGSDAMSQNITWSVAIEEQFYIFWPLIFVFLRRKFWVFGIFSVVITSLIFRLVHADNGHILYFHTLSVIIDMSIGGLFAYLVSYSDKVRLFFEKNGTKYHVVYLLIFSIFYLSTQYFSIPYDAAFNRLFLSTNIAFLITSQAITKEKSILNLGNYRFISKWGKYTYGIYLLHPIAITFVDIVFRVLKIEIDVFNGILVKSSLSLILTFMFSYFSFHYFEAYFLRFKEKFAVMKIQGAKNIYERHTEDK